MMAKIAIDVVLLPSDEMMDKTIEINKELLKKFEKKIVLHKEKCLPHISLCMGCIEEEQLPEIGKVLEGIVKEFSLFGLTSKRFGIEVLPTGKKASYFDVENNEKLQKLHETIMKRLWKYLSYNVDESMLFNPPEVEEATLHWIRSYGKHYHDPSKFDPHLTIGFGETDRFKFPINFTTSRLALCQLGNYCTCRKILWEGKLREL